MIPVASGALLRMRPLDRYLEDSWTKDLFKLSYLTKMAEL